MRPKSEIYTPKRDDEHPRPFHMRVPPPRGGAYLAAISDVSQCDIFVVEMSYRYKRIYSTHDTTSASSIFPRKGSLGYVTNHKIKPCDAAMPSLHLLRFNPEIASSQGNKHVILVKHKLIFFGGFWKQMGNSLYLNFRTNIKLLIFTQLPVCLPAKSTRATNVVYPIHHVIYNSDRFQPLCYFTR